MMEICVPNVRRSGRGLRQRRLRSVAELPDDLISEILARVPYRSLCRFKCVSRSWLALCSSPDMIRKTLSGFFYRRHSADHFRFVSTSGRFPLMEGPLFSFLPPKSTGFDIVDSCNGLLLFDRHNRHGSSRYFVCNPATGNWIDLPAKQWNPATGNWIDLPAKQWIFNPEVIRLGFDPAESPHFRVFWIVWVTEGEGPYMPDKVAGVQIYSSETREWVYRQSGWGTDAIVRYYTRTAFFNGTLHLTTSGSSASIITVDMDGKTWRTIPAAPPRFSFIIGPSGGYFYAVRTFRDLDNDHRLSIWALEDYGGVHEEWILKHTATLFAGTEDYYMVHAIAIHPQDPLIFLTTTATLGTGIRRALASYDFMNNEVHTIKTLGQSSEKDILELGQSFEKDILEQQGKHLPYPYTPCFSKWLPDGH